MQSSQRNFFIKSQTQYRCISSDEIKRNTLRSKYIANELKKKRKKEKKKEGGAKEREVENAFFLAPCRKQDKMSGAKDLGLSSCTRNRALKH